MHKLKIVYDGEPDYELEKRLIGVLDYAGYEFVGSGCNMIKNKRDLEFESPNKFVRREPPDNVEVALPQGDGVKG